MIHFYPNTLQGRPSASRGVLGKRIIGLLGVLALAWIISITSVDTTRWSISGGEGRSVVTELDFEGLVMALDNDANADVRSRAAGALAELHDARAVHPLERAATSDPSVGVRHAAAAALALLKEHWASNAGTDNEYVGAVAVAPGNPDLLYLAKLNELAVSRDGGASWGLLSHTLPSHVSALAVDPSHANVIYAGADSLGLYKSIDDGVTWHAVNEGLGMAAGVRLRVTALAIDPENPDRIFAARGVWIGTSRVELIPLGLMESRDSGASWSAVDIPAMDQVIGRLVVTNEKLYAAAGERVIVVELAAENEL